MHDLSKDNLLLVGGSETVTQETFLGTLLNTVKHLLKRGALSLDWPLLSSRRAGSGSLPAGAIKQGTCFLQRHVNAFLSE